MKRYKQTTLAFLLTAIILFIMPVASFSDVVFIPLDPITIGLNMPEDVAVSQDGTVYVVDGSRNKVLIYDSAHQLAGSLSILKPTSVAVNVDGTIYIGTNDNLSVKIFDSSLNLVGSLGVGADEFELPRNIAVERFQYLH